MARRLPRLALPTSTFVAGLTTRPADGWFDAVDRAEWFDYGCDLFDAGCYFEAHELWEQCWRAARAVGNVDDATFLQGLIKVAAAGVKQLAAAPVPRDAHLAAGARLLQGVAPRRGLDRAVLDRVIAEIASGRSPVLGP